MKDLHYIPIPIRTAIIEKYAEKWEIEDMFKDSVRSELELKLFGYPKVRRMVDEGFTKADKEVDRERYSQYSSEWFMDIIGNIPGPGDLDNYQGEVEAEQGEKGEEAPKQDLKTLIKDFYPQVRDRLDGIILHFDFDKVAAIMNGMGWKWGDNIPSRTELRLYAYGLLKAAIETGMGARGQGFEVILKHTPDYDKPLDFNNQVVFGLRFIVEEQYA